MIERDELTQVERDKLTINPDFDFEALASRPLESIPSGELAMFKWNGIYGQRQKGFFMMRVRIPGGLLTASQLERIAELAETYARGQLCATTRQTLQFHWLRLEDLHRVLAGLGEVGLDTKNACGDVTRNVVTCPLQGVCPHEVKDVRPMIEAVAQDPELRDRQRNLPRKHKISIAGCGRACGQTLMNCEGWYPVRRQRGGQDEVGWRYRAGGGLGARPHLARPVFAWVPEDLVLPVIQATTEVFRQTGNRRVRALARLKIVIAEIGADAFTDRVLEVLRARGVSGIERLERADGPLPIGPMFTDGQAAIAQRQAGFNTVRALLPRGEFTAVQGHRFAAWARSHGDGTLMLTARQNLEWRGVAEANVGSLQRAIEGAGLSSEGHERLPDMVACVGTTQCNVAAADAPDAYRRLMAALAPDRAFWTEIGPLRIHLSGCPNSCAQHWIADIGLRGGRRTTEVGPEETFTLCVGGSLDGAGHIAQPIGVVPSRDLAPTIRRLLETYLAERSDSGETFGQYARRVGTAALAQRLGLPDGGA